MSVKKSRAFGAQHAKKAHLMQQTGGLAAEIQDLREDTEIGFKNLEDRAGYPELDYVDGGLPLAGGDVVIHGRNLLQGQTFDSLTIAQSAIRLQLFALKPGASGITVVVIAGSGALGAAYNPTTKVLTITLAAGGSTADAVATEINKNGGVAEGIIRANVSVGGTLTLAQASAPMTGGTGTWSENKVMVAGLEALPANETGTTSTAKWSDTTISVTIPSLAGAGLAVEDLYQLTVMSDGKRSDPLVGGGEKVTSGLPELDWLDSTIAAAGSTGVLRGRNLLQGQTFDTVRFGTGTSQLDFTAMKPGVSGFSVVIVAGAGALSAVIAGSLLTVTLAVGGNTADEVATEVNKALPNTCKGVIRCVSGGAGAAAAHTVVVMAGGAGLYSGNKVLVSGAESLPLHATGTTPAATWEDTVISVTVPALTGLSPARAAGDAAALQVQSNGLTTHQVTAILA
jgi:hypothetical protein